jgi:hypothetical protein
MPRVDTVTPSATRLLPPSAAGVKCLSILHTRLAKRSLTIAPKLVAVQRLPSRAAVTPACRAHELTAVPNLPGQSTSEPAAIDIRRTNPLLQSALTIDRNQWIEYKGFMKILHTVDNIHRPTRGSHYGT